jgi:hypothetical protein
VFKKTIASIAIVSALLFGGMAAKEKPAPTGTLTPVENPAHFGTLEHFTYSTNAKIPGYTKLNISVNCYENGEWKWQFVDWAESDFGWIIGGPGSSWNVLGDNPSCTAQLFYYTKTDLIVLATTTFPVV